MNVFASSTPRAAEWRWRIVAQFASELIGTLGRNGLAAANVSVSWPSRTAWVA